MNRELLNLTIFFIAIAKFLAMTGLGLAGAVAILAECCGFRVVALGFEQVRAEQLATQENRCLTRENWATSSARKLARTA